MSVLWGLVGALVFGCVFIVFLMGLLAKKWLMGDAPRWLKAMRIAALLWLGLGLLGAGVESTTELVNGIDAFAKAVEDQKSAVFTKHVAVASGRLFWGALFTIPLPALLLGLSAVLQLKIAPIKEL